MVVVVATLVDVEVVWSTWWSQLYSMLHLFEVPSVLSTDMMLAIVGIDHLPLSIAQLILL